ncbi:demethylspheroidene O-methyltransferase [Palleronia pelagia]|uniref:Demethylspheroidene O-methyltransferase n=1 Tax=Palleronia pelagia TaxID=387096 RepID=A0A1H8FC76_9RHOB|nr:demethylspheroidene O-methyltransferase [Palleronia pelagia]
MADLPLPDSPRRGWFAPGWRNRLIASRPFQRWAARFPLTRSHVRNEGTAIFDLVAGFATSQALRALIELRVLHLLRDEPLTAGDAAARLSLPPRRAEVLLRAGVAMGLLRLRRGRFVTAARGAALLGVPGLEDMIRHHDVLYRDLADPTAFFRGETEPELASFWPYVFGAGGDVSPEDSARYSRLMADSQGLVAEDTLSQVALCGIRCLMDVGGGTGVFLSHVARRAPDLKLMLFDLPPVLEAARESLSRQGLSQRVALHPGSFKTDSLPGEADAISLVRVLYDHDDAQVADLLSKARAALPSGGRLIVSEPMTGGDRPHVAGDVYFALYCMAMGTGRARSGAEIGALMGAAGFVDIRPGRAHRPFVTSTITAHRS